MTTHADWPAVLKWAEEHGIENLKGRVATAGILAQEAQTTLTVLLAGIGGSLAYAVKMADPAEASAIGFGAAWLCAYLALLSAALVLLLLKFKPIPATYQEPKNLTKAGFSIDAIRAKELENLQTRIETATARNKETAFRLNVLRGATVASPLVFALAAAYYTPSAKPEAPGVKLLCVQGAVSSPSATLTCRLAG